MLRYHPEIPSSNSLNRTYDLLMLVHECLKQIILLHWSQLFLLPHQDLQEDILGIGVRFLADSGEVESVKAVVFRNEDVFDDEAGNQSKFLGARDTWSCGTLSAAAGCGGGSYWVDRSSGDGDLLRSGLLLVVIAGPAHHLDERRALYAPGTTEQQDGEVERVANQNVYGWTFGRAEGTCLNNMQP